MCRPTNGTPTQDVCPYLGYQRFDCNHDDYFHTRPAVGSYLFSHWDAALNQFLISANGVRADAIAFSNAKSKLFAPTNVFKPNDTVQVRIHLVDQYRADLNGASVSLTVGKLNTAVRCTLTVVSKATGNADTFCQIPTPSTNPYGVWNVHISAVSLNAYPFDALTSVTDQTFSVQ